jgi:hypothetical protein
MHPWFVCGAVEAPAAEVGDVDAAATPEPAAGGKKKKKKAGKDVDSLFAALADDAAGACVSERPCGGGEIRTTEALCGVM